MTTTRKPPNLRDKLAACLIQIMDIPRDEAKKMSVDQILSLVEWDHDPVAYNTARDLGWTPDEINHPTNLSPRFIKAHRAKSAKVDTPLAAKGKRLTEAQEAHRRKMLAKTDYSWSDVSGPHAQSIQDERARWPSRPFPKQQNPWGKK